MFENIGTGYASEITFVGSLLSFKPVSQARNPSKKALKDLDPFKNGINYLGAGYKVETYLFHIVQRDKLSKKPLNITVVYKDSTDTKEKKSFVFEFGNWENASQFISPQKR